MGFLVGLLALLAGIWLGLTVPDWDLRLTFLGHRSMITHGFWLPLFVYFIYRRQPHVVWRLLLLGVGMATAVHFAFDLFPVRWQGFALITVPFWGRLTPFWSWAWLAGSLIASLIFVFEMVESRRDLGLVLLCLVSIFSFEALGERLIVWPLCVLVLFTSITLPLEYSPITYLRQRYNQMT